MINMNTKSLMFGFLVLILISSSVSAFNLLDWIKNK